VRLHRWTLRRRSGTFTWGVLTGLVALTAAIALPKEGLEVSIGHFWWIALGSIAVIALVVARSGLWSATGAYASVFWCFHFGLIAVLGSGLIAPHELQPWDQVWLLGPFGADAAVLALIGFTAFASGASLINASASSADSRTNPPDPNEGAHPFGPAGSALVFAAIVLWCGSVLMTSGASGFYGAYGDYLNGIDQVGGFMGLVWLALGGGIVMSVTGRHGWLRTSAIAAFGCMALIALPIGLRGEIMFPTVAALVAAARCGWTLSPAKACAFLIGLLIVIPSVREIRNTGLQGLSDVALELRTFDAFVEMGGSLHPVEKVVRWRAEGEALDMGSSYWAPIERAAARVLPGVETSAAEGDMRIMNVLVTDRVGPIGFSPVAEAYRNFGAVGVVLVLGLLGAGLAAIDGIADRRLAVLAIAILYVPLLTNVRNSFVSVPLQCGVGALFVAGIHVMRHVSAAIRCRAYARPAYVRSEI
jgi:O-antigen polysaccharide polymerase Wzy